MTTSTGGHGIIRENPAPLSGLIIIGFGSFLGLKPQAVFLHRFAVKTGCETNHGPRPWTLGTQLFCGLISVTRLFCKKAVSPKLRQRREGLAYRLTWHQTGVRPRKRVKPGTNGLRLRRKLTYRLRDSISWWSPRIFEAAQQVRCPALYNLWARLALVIYKVLVYAGIRTKPRPQSTDRQNV